MAKTVKVGIVGTGFVGDIHHAAFKGWVRDAEVVAVASPHNAAKFAEERGIPNAYGDYREMLKDKEIDVIDIGIPNDLHCQVVVDAAKAGKHVIIEKPLCVTLEEADEMIEACKKAGVLLMYAEELLFAPKYVRAKIADRRRRDRRAVPGQAIGGASRSAHALVLGCEPLRRRRDAGYGLPFDRIHALGAGQAQGQERDRLYGDVCPPGHAPRAKTIPMPSSNTKANKLAMIENSWAKGGGVDDRCEIYGKKGHTRADLLRGSSLLTYSEEGYGYAVEKAGTTKGYTFTMFEEIWNYGFPQEMQHFVNCVLGKETCMETGEDGREVLKIMYAAYQSAGEGRKIEFAIQSAQGQETD